MFFSSISGQSGPSLDLSAKAFLEATSLTGNATISAAVDTLVRAWKTAGQWDRTVAIYPFVGGTAAKHMLNLKDPRDLDAANRISWAGGLTHDANGVTPNGSTGYGNTHIDPHLQIPQHSASIGFYNRSASFPGGGDYFLCGANVNLKFDIFSNDYIYIGNSFVNAAGATSDFAFRPVASYQGLLSYVINGPKSQRVFRNKAELHNYTTEIFGFWSSVPTVANRKLWLFGNNNNGVLQNPLDSRSCGFFFVAWGMGTAEYNAIADAIAAFQTTLGRNV